MCAVGYCWTALSLSGCHRHTASPQHSAVCFHCPCLRVHQQTGGATPTPAFFEGLLALKQLRVLEVLPGVYGQIVGYDMDVGQADAGGFDRERILRVYFLFFLLQGRLCFWFDRFASCVPSSGLSLQDDAAVASLPTWCWCALLFQLLLASSKLNCVCRQPPCGPHGCG